MEGKIPVLGPPCSQNCPLGTGQPISTKLVDPAHDSHVELVTQAQSIDQTVKESAREDSHWNGANRRTADARLT